jgi:L-fuculose-phosphate aldolase
VTAQTQYSLRRRQVAELIDVCHRLAAKGFVAATDGNVSIRLPGGNMLITCSGVSQGMVAGKDFVEVTAGGRVVASKRAASTEVGMHAFIYRERPDVRAVVHAHPPTATGFAVARISLEACLLPEAVVGLGAIPLAPYATPSTDEVALSISPFVKNAQAILLSNHGVVTFGRDLLDAFFKMEKVEHAAQIVLVARMLGGAIPLSEEELEKLRRVSIKSYGVRLDGMFPRRPGRSATREKN